MKQREFDLQLDKNLNKTMIVENPTGRGPGQPGFFCEACNRTYKDTTAYLDHINGRQRESQLLCAHVFPMTNPLYYYYRFTENGPDYTYRSFYC